MGVIQLNPWYHDLPTMRADLVDAVDTIEAAGGNADGVSAWLNKWGTDSSPQGRVGGLYYKDGIFRPLVPWDLSLVSATPIGVIASGAGTSYTLASSPLTLPAGASVVQAWSMSTGLVGGQVALTRDGLDVDLAAARTLVAGDLLVDTRRCEFGALGVGWTIGRGPAYFSSSGLVTDGGWLRVEGAVDFGAGLPFSYTIAAKGTPNESSAGDGSYAYAGIANATELVAVGYGRTGTDWRMVWADGSIASPGRVFAAGGTLGAPGTTQILAMINNSSADGVGNGTLIAESRLVDSTLLSVRSAGRTPSLQMLDGVNAPSGLYFDSQAVGGGSYPVTWTEIQVAVTT